MFRSRRLAVSEHGRPFWLLLGLAVLLLSWVSAGNARMPDPGAAIEALERDLAALRIQLDGIGHPQSTKAPDGGHTLDADLGDGGEAFRRRSLVTVARTAGRHLERVIIGYRRAADPVEARRAAGLRLDLVELQHRLEQLARSADPDAAAARRDAVLLLDRLDRALARIIADHGGPAPSGRMLPRSPVAPSPDVEGR